MGLIYNALMQALVPVLRRKLRKRAEVEPLYAMHMDERWGRYAHPPQQVEVWLHAVSLGEARAARVLIDRLREHRPDWRWVFTQGTATGRAELAQCLRPGDVQVWQPWDTPQAVQSFLRHFQPRLGLIMETEVWPNWVACSRERKLPLVLVNARLSQRSLSKAQRLWFWSRQAYQGIALALAQTPADAQRLAAAGVPATRVLGNLKYDAHIRKDLWQAGRAVRMGWDRPVVMLASSREGEELAWVKALQQVPHRFAGVTWLVVPRHPQRFDELAQTLQHQGVDVVRRSRLPANASEWPEMAPGQVILGDSLGEMALYYGLADLALMGGSFAQLGGQNLIEACACECPVIVGPHTFNFQQATELALAAGAAHRAADWSAALDCVAQWLADPDALGHRRKAALQFTQSHQGATDASVRDILALAQSLGLTGAIRAESDG